MTYILGLLYIEGQTPDDIYTRPAIHRGSDSRRHILGLLYIEGQTPDDIYILGLLYIEGQTPDDIYTRPAIPNLYSICI